MHTTTLRKVGGSVMLAVPPALLEVLRLKPGAKVGVSVDQGRLVVEPAITPRYTLEALLAACEPDAPLDPDDAAWTAGQPVGQELL